MVFFIDDLYLIRIFYKKLHSIKMSIQNIYSVKWIKFTCIFFQRLDFFINVKNAFSICPVVRIMDFLRGICFVTQKKDCLFESKHK